MLLHELKPIHSPKEKRARVGQGGKRGHTSGRGQKGQRSRSGRRIRPAERDLILRLPKLRGYKNKPLGPKAEVVHVGDLEQAKDAVISKRILAAAGLIGNARGTVKILDGGDIKKAVTISGIKVSAKARAKIEAAGGKIG